MKAVLVARKGPLPTLVAGVACFLGCAEPGLPPGGPQDLSTPEVQAVSPPPGAVGVPRDAVLVVSFAKKIDAATVERALWVTPGESGKLEVDTEAAQIAISLGRLLPADTTVAVLLTTAIHDRKREGRQNAMVAPYRWVFSTGPEIWPGKLEGKVEGVGTGDEGLVLVALYPALADTVPDPGSETPVAITQARRDGTFLIEGLPVRGERWWLLTMFDRDGNREIRGTSEFVSAGADTLRLTAERPAVSLTLELVDPRAPGDIQGTLERAEADTIPVWVEVGGDSLQTPVVAAVKTRVAPDGTFNVRRVPPGRYLVRAFCDVNGDGKRGPEEELWEISPAAVLPGETVELGTTSFAPCPSPPAKP